MEGIEQIKVDTSFGEVKIKGEDRTDCNVTAKINGNAPTYDEAKQLAEETKIILETQGKTLIIRADKPHNSGHNRSIGIAYDIIIPTKTSIKCETSFGAVKLKNITGEVWAKSSFGKIDAENITGKINLETSYGEVDCEKITSADFWAKTSFGKIDIRFADACPADMKAKIETSYGEADCDLPANFAGQVNIETSFGSIKTDLPILVKGEVGKSHITGSIGNGNGSLDLKTSFGSVKIK
jgi:DUF4097 and DUF4098 domain-containing protein YvlB